MNCSPPSSSVHGDSPGKNSGVDCHALLQRLFPTPGSKLGLLHCRPILYHLSHQGSPRVSIKDEETEPSTLVRVVAGKLRKCVVQSCLTLCNSMDYRPPGSSVHGDSPGKSTGVGCHALLLQGIFPTQGSNPGLPHGRQIVLPTEPPGKPKNTGVGSLSLLQGIFLTQESK